ncbi:Ribosomal small subunit pseudouridine synthase A [BD1-7 clade bacterium]|uniref:Pseudouridine synthase n=1 Tax=BD1-7 clade bacterium TaxID=2029982 RepID=A0A5S9PH95_9GAMM|nr:Ribosomal small subunit pseudouridine synthase A [BD1-7 clade bacterium]
MSISRTRLDRFISERLSINRRDVRLLVAQRRIQVDGRPASAINQVIDRFSQICFDDEVLQSEQPTYIKFHKPTGVVSATEDPVHKTVIDLIDHPKADQLHIVGRLDYNTTGLMLLTNNGHWSRQLTLPGSKVEKHYRVTLQNPITDDYAAAFAEGMYFPFEDITTAPAQLTLIDEFTADVVLTEGKYHQIKRMFGRFRNPVVALHRSAIGELTLANENDDLDTGEWRELTLREKAVLDGST